MISYAKYWTFMGFAAVQRTVISQPFCLSESQLWALNKLDEDKNPN